MENQSKNNLLDFVKMLVLLLMTTPSCNIMYIVFHQNLSNEKFGLFIATSYIIVSGKKLKKKYFNWACFLLIAVLLPSFIRFLYGQPFLLDQDISLILFAISLPIYMSLFLFRPDRNDSIFIAIIVIQSFAFLLQLVGKYAGVPVESFFIHNSVQQNYTYPQVAFGLYRVSGFFNESSQIGIMFCMAFWYFRGRKYDFVFIPLVLLTFSMTAYLMLMIMCIRLLKKKRVLFVLLFGAAILLFQFGSFLGVIADTIVYRFTLVLNAKNDISTSDPRLIALSKNMSDISNNLLLGVGASMKNADRWDILSVYILPYGVVGGIVWIGFVFYMLFSLSIFWVYLPVTITNITMLSYVNLFSFILAATKKEIGRADGQKNMRSVGCI